MELPLFAIDVILQHVNFRTFGKLQLTARVVQELSECDSHVDFCSDYRTLLDTTLEERFMLACQWGDLDLFHELLPLGPFNYLEAIAYASDRGHHRIVDELRQLGTTYDRLLLDAVANSDYDAVQRYWKLDDQSKKGIVHLAMSQSNLNIIRFLQEKNVEISTRQYLKGMYFAIRRRDHAMISHFSDKAPATDASYFEAACLTCDVGYAAMFASHARGPIDDILSNIVTLYRYGCDVAAMVHWLAQFYSKNTTSATPDYLTQVRMCIGEEFVMPTDATARQQLFEIALDAVCVSALQKFLDAGVNVEYKHLVQLLSNSGLIDVLTALQLLLPRCALTLRQRHLLLKSQIVNAGYRVPIIELLAMPFPLPFEYMYPIFGTLFWPNLAAALNCSARLGKPYPPNALLLIAVMHDNTALLHYAVERGATNFTTALSIADADTAVARWLRPRVEGEIPIHDEQSEVRLIAQAHFGLDIA